MEWASNKADQGWRAVHDTGAGLFGYDTYVQQEAQQQAQEAARAGTKERAQIAEENRALADEVTGFDSPGISSSVNWTAFDHEQIYNTNQDTIEEGKAVETARAWQDLGKSLRARAVPFDSKLREIISSGWRGEAAEQAQRMGAPVRNWMEGSGAAFEMTGNNLETAASGAGQVRSAIPEPEGYRWGRTAVAALAGGPGVTADVVSQMREQREAEKQAQETMARVYSPTLTDVDARMPAFQKPDGTPAEPPSPRRPHQDTGWGTPVRPPGPGGGGGEVGGGGGSYPAPGGGGAVPWRESPGGGGEVPPDPRQDGSSEGSRGSDGGRGGGRGSDGPDETESSWNTPAPGPTPGPGAVAPPSGGGGGGGGGAGMVPGLGGGGAGGAGGVRGAGGVGAGGVGRAGGGAGSGMTAGGRAGAGPVGAGGGPAGAGAAGAAGRGGSSAGRGMMGGGMGAGQRGQGGEDQEHERPSWLEEQDDVWLDDMPKTAPPVLGE
ncbi:PPE domain-containing protein [Saccharopolyspora cebuensis]